MKDFGINITVIRIFSSCCLAVLYIVVHYDKMENVLRQENPLILWTLLQHNAIKCKITGTNPLLKKIK